MDYRMKKQGIYKEKGNGVSVNIDLDIYRIVRCLCITGVLIVGIVFGTDIAKKYLEKEEKEI